MSCSDGNGIQLRITSNQYKPPRAQLFGVEGPVVAEQIKREKFAPFLLEQTIALLGAVVQQLVSNWLAQGTVRIISGQGESSQMEITFVTFVYGLLFWIFANRELFKIRERVRSFTERLMVVNRSATPFDRLHC
ncbi:MAG TPA: hypothetical protein V6C86_13590 [Oculatellaceae cyanobacterium]